VPYIVGSVLDPVSNELEVMHGLKGVCPWCTPTHIVGSVLDPVSNELEVVHGLKCVRDAPPTQPRPNPALPLFTYTVGGVEEPTGHL